MTRLPRAVLVLVLAVPVFAQDDPFLSETEADVPHLITEATRGDWNTRIKAVHTLGRLGSIEGLSEGVTDGDWQIRLTAVHWLGRQGDSAVPMLGHVLRSEPCRIIRLAAIHWLGSIGPSAIPALREALGESSPMIRVTSAYWLKKLETGESAGEDSPPPQADDPGLLQGASEEDLRGCQAVNLPPTKMIPLAYSSPADAPPTVAKRNSPLSGQAIQTEEEWIEPRPKRRPAASAKKRSERAKALELLSDAGKVPKPAAKPEPAASAPPAEVAKSTDPLTIPPLAKAPEEPLSDAAAVPAKSADKPLPDTTADPVAGARPKPEAELAGRPLGSPEAKLGTAPTWHLVKGEQREAALTVREPDPAQPPHDPLPDLVKALHSSNWRHRYRAADLLGMMGAQASPAVGELITLVKDKKSAVRASAALALGNIGPAADDAVPALTKCLRDRHADVRYSAAVALGRMGTPAADRAFHRHVRTEAARMIENAD